jgi:glyoxylase-like metal-dependent hydrolase (beta-lactamase superfamily II)
MDLAVTTVVVSPFEQNCRVILDRETGEAVVVDPGDDAERILDAVRRSGGKVRYLLATHGHLDHVGAVVPVREALKAPFAIHGGDVPFLRALPEHGRMFGMLGLRTPSVDIDLAEVEELPFGSGAIRVVHTPGHTPGGSTFFFGEGGKKGLFGDSLFHLSIGRTDLGGDPDVYRKTLCEVILPLPDDVEVHSGHGPSSTMAIEKAQNPFLNGTVDLGCPTADL